MLNIEEIKIAGIKKELSTELYSRLQFIRKHANDACLDDFHIFVSQVTIIKDLVTESEQLYSTLLELNAFDNKNTVEDTDKKHVYGSIG
jgi:hypothetical protein